MFCWILCGQVDIGLGTRRPGRPVRRRRLRDRPAATRAERSWTHEFDSPSFVPFPAGTVDGIIQSTLWCFKRPNVHAFQLWTLVVTICNWGGDSGIHQSCYINTDLGTQHQCFFTYIMYFFIIYSKIQNTLCNYFDRNEPKFNRKLRFCASKTKGAQTLPKYSKTGSRALLDHQKP